MDSAFSRGGASGDHDALDFAAGENADDASDDANDHVDASSRSDVSDARPGAFRADAIDADHTPSLPDRCRDPRRAAFALVVRVGVARGVGALELPPLAELAEPRRSLRPRPRFRERPPPKLELGLGPFGELAELALRSEKAASASPSSTSEAPKWRETAAMSPGFAASSSGDITSRS